MTAARSYHQFLGNGIDAVLIGPSGAMSPQASQGLDRCYWYKSDLYYADARRFAEGDDPRQFIGASPGGTSHQLAPLARVWYEVLDADGRPTPLTAHDRRLDTATGILHTTATFGRARLLLRTIVAVDTPYLFFEATADADLIVRARVAPGLWPEDDEQSDPITDVEAISGTQPGAVFRVGQERCSLRLAARSDSLRDGGYDEEGAWLLLHGRSLRWWAVLQSTRYPQETGPLLNLSSREPAGLSTGGPQVDLPDKDYNQLHGFSLYMFRAMQHRYSGGLPVNNLRRTFNSHVFWDGAFVQRALLEAGQVGPAREAWRFLARTREAAAANASATFGSPGLHWDWETTHRGERAYVPWLQQRFQVHNTPLLAHMIAADYRATRDRAVLREGYDLLAGAATFLLHSVLIERDGRLETRPLVGSHEADARVVNDGATVAASLRLLRDVTLAARVLGRDDELVRRCAAAVPRLRSTVARLYNGRYFQASRDEDRLNTSSLTPIYPADAVPATDPRARRTAGAYRARYAGRMAGHGNNEMGFPWSAGILARILAYQGETDAAWEQLDLARPALCAEGGSAEYVDARGQWNLQYFSTAQAALCSAVHATLLQEHGADLLLFPAIPSAWDECAFQDFLVAGLRVSARYSHRAVSLVAVNDSDHARRAVFRFGSNSSEVILAPGAQQALALEVGDARGTR